MSDSGVEAFGRSEKGADCVIIVNKVDDKSDESVVPILGVGETINVDCFCILRHLERVLSHTADAVSMFIVAE